MMSSTEIAQMMQAQNSMFMGQNQYANQIGMPVPVAGTGGFGRAATPPMFGGHQPFSYAPGGMMGPGPQGGNRFAAGAMSAMGSTASLAGTAIGIGGMMGAFGKIGGALVDPFSMFGLARGAGTAMGMGTMGGIGMGLAGAALPLAGAYAAGQVVNSFVQGGQQQSAINNSLSQNFSHFNPQSRTGMGFSRQDSQAIGSQIRELAHIPEMMTSVDELTKLMPKLKQTGMLQGVKEAGEFNKRFKDAVTTIREMSKVLGTTMEEATEFFAQSRGAGFIGKQAQLKNVMNAQFTSGVTGMSMNQVMTMQQQGAGMATQVGARRSLGANAVTSMAQTLGLAQREGRISEGQLEDATGLQGPEAVQAMATRMTEGMYNFSQKSPVGKLLMAGMAKFDETGKAVGLDDKLVKQFQSGALTVDDLKRRAGGLTHDQKISFTHRQAGTLAMDLAGKIGAGGAFEMFNQLAGNKGTDAAMMVMGRHTGFNEAELDVASQMGQQGAGSGQMNQMSKFKGQEAAIRERTDPGVIMKRLGTRMHSYLLGGVEQSGARVFNEIGKAYDSFIDDMVGRHVVSLSKEGADKLALAMAGGGSADLKKMFAAAHGVTGGGGQKFGMTDALTVGSTLMSFGLGGIAGSMAGGDVSGAFGRGAAALRNTDAAAFLYRDSTTNGRTDEAQGEFARAQLGGTGAEGSLMIGRALNNGLASSEAGDAAQGALRRITAGIEGFRGMGDRKKYDELSSGIQSAILGGMDGHVRNAQGELEIFNGMNDIDDVDELYERFGGKEGVEKMLSSMEGGDVKSKDAAKLLRAGIAGSKNFKGSLSAAIIGGAQGKYEGHDTQVDLANIGADGATDFTDVASAAKALEKAEDALTGGIMHSALVEDETLAAIKTSGASRGVLSALRGGDSAESQAEAKKVDAALRLHPAAAVKELNRLGYDVKEGDIDALKKGQDSLDHADPERQGKIFGAIAAYDAAQGAADTQVIRSGFTGAGADLTESAKGLEGKYGHKELSGMAEVYKKFGQGKGSIEEVQAAGASLLKAIQDAKGDDKGALIDAAGDFGSAASATLSQTKGLGSVKSEAGLKSALAKLGIKDPKQIAAVTKGINASDGISKDEMERLQGSIFGLKSAGMTAAAGQGKIGTVEEQTLKTLQDMNKTMAIVATVLANKYGDDKVKTDAENAYKETHPAPGTGEKPK